MQNEVELFLDKVVLNEEVRDLILGAKKGMYSVLIDLGEREGWLTLHASSTLLITPYGNRLTILHEGASGSGKSEMNENIHRQKDGSILFGQNIVTGDKFIISLPVNCFVENTMPFYKDPELDELGKKILLCLYDKGIVKDFEDMLGIPSYYNVMEGE